MSGFISEDLKRFNCLISEIDAVYHDAALKLGLSDSAMRILYTICGRGDMCLLQDIIRSGISKQTVNSALRKLEGEGVVYLEAADARKKRVCLTEKGRELVKNTVLRVMEKETEIFSSWQQEERETYIALTEQYLTSFKEKIKEI